MLASVAALSGVAYAGEVTGVAPVTSAGADLLVKGKDTVSVRFSGRTEFQWSDAGADGFGFRRVRLGSKAKLGSGWGSEIVFDITDGSNGLANTTQDAFVDKAVITKTIGGTKFSFGRSKVVFGYEETSSSSKGVFIERSRLNDRLDGQGPGGFYDRQSNITVSQDFGGGFSGALSVADQTTGGQDPSYFGRLQWSNDAVTVGVDYADNNTLDAFTAYVDYKQGGFNVLVEYYDADLAGVDVDGFVVRASYRIGDFEPVVRYSDYDFGASSDEELLIGFNYYIAPQVTFLAAYRDTEEGGVDADSFTARLRVLW